MFHFPQKSTSRRSRDDFCQLSCRNVTKLQRTQSQKPDWHFFSNVQPNQSDGHYSIAYKTKKYAATLYHFGRYWFSRIASCYSHSQLSPKLNLKRRPILLHVTLNFACLRSNSFSSIVFSTPAKLFLSLERLFTYSTYRWSNIRFESLCTVGAKFFDSKRSRKKVTDFLLLF